MEIVLTPGELPSLQFYPRSSGIFPDFLCFRGSTHSKVISALNPFSPLPAPRLLFSLSWGLIFTSSKPPEDLANLQAGPQVLLSVTPASLARGG